GRSLSAFDAPTTPDGHPFRVYPPFARAAKAAAWDDPLPTPSRVPVPENLTTGGLGAGPGVFDLDGAVELPPPTPAVALERLRWFVDQRVDRYGRARNFLGTDGTSRLSPYLRFGLVSPRQVAAATGRRG